MIVSAGLRQARRLMFLPLALLLAACGNLDQLEYSPQTTPEQWCEQRPCIEVGDTVVNEPLGSFLVFALAALWIGVGVYFLVSRAGQRSRSWFGVSLILGGLGAAQAGVSYQLFSYVLKCEGLQYCRLTNGFEVGYSVTQAFSVSAMLIAVAIACTTGGVRRGFIIYAAVNAAVYVVVTIMGVLQPSAFLLSFEMLMLFAVPGLIMVAYISGRRFRADHDRMSRSILIAIGLFVLVQVAYFAYYAAGITGTLWNDGDGFYFSQNDVLHVGMILWLIYVWRTLGPTLRDAEQEPERTAAVGE
jgi:hypothetical protein